MAQRSAVGRHEQTVRSSGDQREAGHWRHGNFGALHYQRARPVRVAREAEPHPCGSAGQEVSGGDVQGGCRHPSSSLRLSESKLEIRNSKIGSAKLGVETPIDLRRVNGSGKHRDLGKAPIGRRKSWRSWESRRRSDEVKCLSVPTREWLGGSRRWA